MLFLRFFRHNLRCNMPYYAVRQGRNAGIYSDWDSCREQVNGYRGAQFKKFNSQEAAERFIAGDNAGTGYGRKRSYQASYSTDNDDDDYSGSYQSSSSSSGYTGSYGNSHYGNSSYSNHSNSSSSSSHHINRYHPYSGGSTSSYSHSSSNSSTDGDLGTTVKSLRNGISNLASQVKALNQQLNRIEQNKAQQRTTQYTVPHTVRHYSTNASSNGHGNGSGSSTSRHGEVYTDGSCVNNGQGGAKAGIGVYWGHNHPRNVAERLPGRQTNNRAEIHAARKAINQAKEMGMQNLTLKTDSQFLIKSVTQWMPNWKRNGWKLSNKEPVKNRQDFEELDRDMQGITVDWVHVRGHQGEHGNEQADKLANEGAVKPQF